jgi:hypothetical protein
LVFRNLRFLCDLLLDLGNEAADRIITGGNRDNRGLDFRNLRFLCDLLLDVLIAHQEMKLPTALLQEETEITEGWISETSVFSATSC